jgi:hypothetical protein
MNQIKKRIFSLLWRAGMMGLAVSLAYIAENLSILELSPQITVFLGLILGEVSKYLNR